ncbi:hypothetical protein SS1G_14237 [Sclerotinia sclerotiorum 1980 UF-70]|uniref:Gas1-like protein n=2 Tax=Sclerotinia sclerotiorum (strain ATCC 18683 / 1980 / Ss-1) TaxID=665079 RepID=A7F9F6_SCLS1|nr:hypothetical protein SS1G_14237 [Sclerotinia sclerotiorum 1980 UF-70]APA09238.1 hypothetical protein sscle_04g040080 [Sclerotinia sclerotiorum 1980 UF-70]EDO00367.1 hypothetical protein SS1G_14237 [Sclerotinia sclerotiorum 1980 UF-70]
MPSLKQFLLLTPALFSAIHAQGVLLSAQGTKGSPASLPLQVQLNTNDVNIINEAEINSNVVNECGRTILNGNIDIGENTETQLANKTVTSVTKGSVVNVVIKQGGTNGKGPYKCDMDPTSNGLGSGQTKLAVKETDVKGGNINLAVTMPSNMSCIGASTGNICTVRCFNAATAGPFGGCFAVMQTDETASKNTPGTIATAQTLKGVEAQVLQNNKDLPAAMKANSEATLNEQGIFAVEALLSSSLAAVPTVAAKAAATPAAAAAAAGKKNGSGNGSGKNGKGNGNGRFGGGNGNGRFPKTFFA